MKELGLADSCGWARSENPLKATWVRAALVPRQRHVGTRSNSDQADDDSLPPQATETRVLTTKTLWISLSWAEMLRILRPWLGLAGKWVLKWVG